MTAEAYPDFGQSDTALYERVLKATGATIPQLQAFLVEELGAEQAVLMGNGKDPRIYASGMPRLADNDARDSITAGVIYLRIN